MRKTICDKCNTDEEVCERKINTSFQVFVFDLCDACFEIVNTKIINYKQEREERDRLFEQNVLKKELPNE